MRFLGFILAFFFVANLWANSYSDIQIISDFDDTLKLTNISSTMDTIGNEFFSKWAFAGSAKLFNEIASKEKPFYLVTASLGFRKILINHFFEKNEFPPYEIVTKKLREKQDIKNYKIVAIRKILKETSCKFILFGDDAQFDPEVYEQIKKEFPERIVASYIHVISGRKIPETSTPFMTYYEVAVYENQAGRLEQNLVKEVEEIVIQSRDKELIPKYQDCKKLEDFQKLMSPKLYKRVEEICLKNQKKEINS